MSLFVYVAMGLQRTGLVCFVVCLFSTRPRFIANSNTVQ